MNQYLIRFVIIIASFFQLFDSLLASNSILAEETKEIAYKAFLNNSIELWENALKEYELLYFQNKQDSLLLYELTKTQYGLLKTSLTLNNREIYDKYKDITLRNTDTLLKLNNKWAEVYALKAGLCGIEMGFESENIMKLGPKASLYLILAMSYNKNEPIVWLEMGCSKLFTPVEYGGSIDEAIECYLKSRKLFEKDQGSVKHNWYYLSLLNWLGRAYLMDKKFEMAISIFEEALSIEPDFKWIKDVLLPKARNGDSNIL